MTNIKLKKALAVGLSAVTLLSTSVYAKSFSDVKKVGSYSWAYDAIDVLSNNDVISGYPDGTFKPETPVSLPEVLQLLIQVVNPSEDEVKEADKKFGKFVDENSKVSWAKKALTLSLYKDIISEAEFKDAASKGFFDNSNKYPNRADIAAFFARGLKLSSKGDESYLKHKDKNKISDNVRGYLASLVKEGIFSSTGSDGYFDGNRAIKRAEAAIITQKGFEFVKRNPLTVKTESMTGKVILASKLNNVNVLIIEKDSSKYSFELNQATSYKIQGKAAKFEDLQSGQTVKVEYEKTNDNDKLGLAKVIDITSSSSNMVGYVNSKGNKQLTIRYRDNSSSIDFRTTGKISTADTKIFDLASDVKITAYGNKIDFDKIAVDDLVEFKTDSNNKITEINVFPKNADVRGKVSDIKSSKTDGYIKLKLNDNKDYTFYLTSSSSNSLLDIRKDDSVTINVNYKVAIDLSSNVGNISGTISYFDSGSYFNRGYLKIKDSSGNEKSYDLADNFKFENNSGSATNPQMRDYDYRGLSVSLVLDSSGRVTKIIRTDKNNQFSARAQVISFNSASNPFNYSQYDVKVKVINSDNRNVILGQTYDIRGIDRSLSLYDILDISGYISSNGQPIIEYTSFNTHYSGEARVDDTYRNKYDFSRYNNGYGYGYGNYDYSTYYR